MLVLQESVDFVTKMDKRVLAGLLLLVLGEFLWGFELKYWDFVLNVGVLNCV